MVWSCQHLVFELLFICQIKTSSILGCISSNPWPGPVTKYVGIKTNLWSKRFEVTSSWISFLILHFTHFLLSLFRSINTAVCPNLLQIPISSIHVPSTSRMAACPSSFLLNYDKRDVQVGREMGGATWQYHLPFSSSVFFRYTNNLLGEFS